MKKILLALCIVLILLSCQLSKPADTILTNHSADRTIKVNLKGYNEITLAPEQSVPIETKSDMNPGSRMENYSPDKRVFYEYTNSSLSFDFYDRKPYKVKVLNLTEQPGILKADGWMDEIEFLVDPDEQERNNWLVYHPNPKFTATTINGSPLPVSAKPEGEEFKVFKVTIGKFN